SRQEQLQGDQTQANTLAGQLPELHEQLEQSRVQTESARQAERAHQHSLEQLEPVWKQAEALDAELQRQQTDLAHRRTEVKQRAGQLRQLSDEQTQKTGVLGELRQQLTEIERYQQTHQAQARLALDPVGLDELMERIGAQKKERQEFEQAWMQRAAQRAENEQQQAKLKAQQKQEQAHSRRLQTEQNELGSRLDALLQGLSLNQLRAQIREKVEQVH